MVFSCAFLSFHSSVFLAFPMCVPFRIALTLVFRLDDGQAVSVADRIGSPADISKVGFKVVPVFLAVNAGNGVEQHMIMQMVVVKVSRDHHLVWQTVPAGEQHIHRADGGVAGHSLSASESSAPPSDRRFQRWLSGGRIPRR